MRVDIHVAAEWCVANPDALVAGIIVTLDQTSDLLSLWRASPLQLVHASAPMARIVESEGNVVENVQEQLEALGDQSFVRNSGVTDSDFGTYFVESVRRVGGTDCYLVRHERVPFPFELAHHPRSQKLSHIEHRIVRNLIHELMTPVNSIEGLGTELLERSDDDETREKLQMLEQSCQSVKTHLTEIVNAFSLHNYETRSFEVENFDLFETLFSVSSKVNRTITERGRTLEFRVDFPGERTSLPMRSYRELLEQLLLHLLDNAIKFTPDGGVIVLRVGMQTGRLGFAVSDNGIGIDPSLHKLIVRPLVLGDMEDTRVHKGLGLGLAAAHDCLMIICDDQDAELGVESAPGQGASFTFDIPYVEPTALDAANAEAELELPMGRENYRVLAAEDNPTQQLIIRRLLTKLGYQCTVCPNGVDALGEYVRGDNRYDLILMDIQMPGISGLEATRLIREYEQKTGLEPVPIVAVTANIEQDVHSQCLRAGMDGHHGKPVRPVVLDELIRRALLGRKLDPAGPV